MGLFQRAFVEDKRGSMFASNTQVLWLCPSLACQHMPSANNASSFCGFDPCTEQCKLSCLSVDLKLDMIRVPVQQLSVGLGPHGWTVCQATLSTVLGNVDWNYCWLPCTQCGWMGIKCMETLWLGFLSALVCIVKCSKLLDLPFRGRHSDTHAHVQCALCLSTVSQL